MSGMKKPAQWRANPNRSSVAAQGHVTTGPADPHALLSRLDKVKQTRNDSWLACCPAHDDRSPSLSIRLDEQSGRLLLKCWSGCDAPDIVAAVGLGLSDLFPRRERDTWSRPLSPSQRWVPRDVLAAVAREALITLLAAESTHRGDRLSRDDLQRLAQAAGRLRNAAREVGAHV